LWGRDSGALRERARIGGEIKNNIVKADIKIVKKPKLNGFYGSSGLSGNSNIPDKKSAGEYRYANSN